MFCPEPTICISSVGSFPVWSGGSEIYVLVLLGEVSLNRKTSYLLGAGMGCLTLGRLAPGGLLVCLRSMSISGGYQHIGSHWYIWGAISMSRRSSACLICHWHLCGSISTTWGSLAYLGIVGISEIPSLQLRAITIRMSDSLPVWQFYAYDH